jgi:chlorite dismutase
MSISGNLQVIFGSSERPAAAAQLRSCATSQEVRSVVGQWLQEHQVSFDPAVAYQGLKIGVDNVIWSACSKVGDFQHETAKITKCVYFLQLIDNCRNSMVNIPCHKA